MARVLFVSEDELRRLFNEGGWWERLERGDYRREVVYDERAAKRSHQPRGARSQIITYHDRYGQLVARVHLYRLRSGKIGGASERPDPKFLRIDDTIYRPLDDGS